MTVRDVDFGPLSVGNERFADALLRFTAPGTVKRGTLLAENTVHGRVQPYVKNGTLDGNGTPVAVLLCDVEASRAGDWEVPVLTRGNLVFSRIVIAADGDNSAVDAIVKDLLTRQGFPVHHVQDLARYDTHD